MNKILIIGNGFDLAHDLKTSFCDFANHIIESKIVSKIPDIINNADYQNPFISSNFCKIIYKYANTPLTSRYDFYSQLAKTAQSSDSQGIYDYLLKNQQSLDVVLNNKFLGKLFKGDYNNWFDIENAYFLELKSLKDIFITNRDYKNIKSLLINLNNEFQEVKEMLTHYLAGIEITKNDNVQRFMDILVRNSKNLYVLNFNYTNTIEQYVSLSNLATNININYIHGTITDNDIIFGYGSDQNDDYNDIKETEIDNFLEYFKTFEYLNRNNYDNLHNDALKSFPNYEVHVLGHSLGTTDKTLLDEIINSNRCDKIYLYKRSDLSNNPAKTKKAFTQLLFAASRILTNEKELRRKVINYTGSTFFPLKETVASKI